MLNVLHNQINNRIQSLDKNTRLAVLFVLIASTLAIFIDFGPKKHFSSEASDESQVQDLDTFIPSGFSLVPIEVINSNGLDSILGRFGMVDLFLENSKAAIIENVRLIRGINQDGTWAVLVPNSFVQELLSAGDRFLVSVRSRKSQSQPILQKTKTKRRTIIYGE